MEKVVKVWMQSNTSNVPVFTTLSVCLFFLQMYKMEMLQFGTGMNLKAEICPQVFIDSTNTN